MVLVPFLRIIVSETYIMISGYYATKEKSMGFGHHTIQVVKGSVGSFHLSKPCCILNFGPKRGDEEQELDLMECFKLKFVYGVMTCVIQMMHKMYFSLPPVM